MFEIVHNYMLKETRNKYYLCISAHMSVSTCKGNVYVDMQEVFSSNYWCRREFRGTKGGIFDCACFHFLQWESIHVTTCNFLRVNLSWAPPTNVPCRHQCRPEQTQGLQNTAFTPRFPEGERDQKREPSPVSLQEKRPWRESLCGLISCFLVQLLHE